MGDNMDELPWFLQPFKRAVNNNRWISVKERLPESQHEGNKDFSDWVQVTLHVGKNDDIVCSAYYCFSEAKWVTERMAVGKVTAWQPLPQPYKAESEDSDADSN